MKIRLNYELFDTDQIYNVQYFRFVNDGPLIITNEQTILYLFISEITFKSLAFLISPRNLFIIIAKVILKKCI